MNSANNNTNDVFTKKVKLAIIGGGFSGLTLAYELSKKPYYEITVFEKDNELGGLAGSFKLENGSIVEKFYHHLFASDVAILDLVKELGLEDKIKFLNSKTGIFCNGKIYSLSSPTDLLKFKELKLVDRIRMGLGVIKAKFINEYKKLEGILAKDWLKKACGKNAYNVVWKPLLKGKFGDSYKEISAVWIWNKFKLRGGSRDDKKKEVLVYFKGGFKGIIDEIYKKLTLKGSLECKERASVRFMLNSPVSVVKKLDDGFLVVVNNKEYSFDNVAFTTSPSALLGAVNFLPDMYAQKLKSIRYLGNICLVLVLNKKFSDTYWLNVADSDFPFVGIIEHTNFDDISNYGGNHILYLSKYLSVQDKLFSYTKDELVSYCIEYLKKINPNFTRDDIKESYLFSDKYSQPIIEKHYSRLLYDMETGIEGLYFTSMSQIYPEDRGTNYAVAYGKKLAKVIDKNITDKKG